MVRPLHDYLDSVLPFMSIVFSMCFVRRKVGVGWLIFLSCSAAARSGGNSRPSSAHHSPARSRATTPPVSAAETAPAQPNGEQARVRDASDLLRSFAMTDLSRAANKSSKSPKTLSNQVKAETRPAKRKFSEYETDQYFPE
eukprot:m.201074 g.201074  ORF g.201074 m.201074 type:complete len:141 (+) comp53824_c0_seq2:1517-1939(+)